MLFLTCQPSFWSRNWPSLYPLGAFAHATFFSSNNSSPRYLYGWPLLASETPEKVSPPQRGLLWSSNLKEAFLHILYHITGFYFLRGTYPYLKLANISLLFLVVSNAPRAKKKETKSSYLLYILSSWRNACHYAGTRVCAEWMNEFSWDNHRESKTLKIPFMLEISILSCPSFSHVFSIHS